ncbi:GLABROUS1 enhancer-binding protein-like [Bidens hawaiensis]|uniref:GLABROUS1 enhancer-binding protein-like n=1 Tax=Bidens hawaiensis TaxID=980011 RepID=UPI004049D832
MAQNGLKPNHSSSDEEEEEDDEEVTSASESDEASDTDSGQKTTQVPVTSQSAKKSQPPDPSSSEGEETDSGNDSDSDSPPNASAVVDRNVKPISSVPVQSKSAKGGESKSVSTPPPAKSKRPAPAPAAVEKDAKKAKNNIVNGERKKPVAPPDPDSSESEEADSDDDNASDSDSPAKKSGVADSSVNVKPVSSKPIEQREAQTLASKRSQIIKSPAKSKQLPASSEKDVKKGKKTTATDDDTKKQLFQRLWSEDDEIAVLQGMIDFKTERNGENPVADPDAFHDFIRKSLHVDFSRSQLMDKIRRLKKKYVNNVAKEKKDGKDRHFTKSHEQKAYELLKLVWDGDGNGKRNTKGKEVKKNQSQKNDNSNLKATGTPASTAGVVKANGVDDKDKLKMDSMEAELEKKVDISRFVQYGLRNDSSILSEEIVKAGMELVEGSKRAELEAKWKNLMELELELYVKRMELLKEQALMVLEAVKSSGN